MNWKDPRKELPPLDKYYRCLALIYSKGELWKGYCDVYFSASTGWRRCETEEQVIIVKWIYIEEIEDQTQDTKWI